MPISTAPASRNRVMTGASAVARFSAATALNWRDRRRLTSQVGSTTSSTMIPTTGISTLVWKLSRTGRARWGIAGQYFGRLLMPSVKSALTSPLAGTTISRLWPGMRSCQARRR